MASPTESPPEGPGFLDREKFEELVERLSRLPFADHLVLVGSAVLFVLSRDLEPATTDVDVALPEELIARDPEAIRRELTAIGFTQVGTTATWIHADGSSIDLLAVREGEQRSRVGGSPRVPAMVFSDLCRILVQPAGVGFVEGSPGHLSRAGLALSKLLTVRLDKGPKDKLHALLLLGEDTDPNPEATQEELVQLARRFPVDEIREVGAEAQAAFLLAEVPPASPVEPWLSCYVHELPRLRLGYQRLLKVLDALDVEESGAS